jgi:hypothetical protein
MIEEGREKDTGLEMPLLCDFLDTVPQSAFNEVHWQEPAPTWEMFQADLKRIVHDMINCRGNTLVC